MKRRRTFRERPRSLYALAQQPRSKQLKRTDWTPNAECYAKRGDRCRLCGVEGHLHLHHLVPRSLSRAGRDDPDNLIGLCASCHYGHHEGMPIPRRVLTLKEQDALERYAPSIGWIGRKYPRETERAA